MPRTSFSISCITIRIPAVAAWPSDVTQVDIVTNSICSQLHAGTIEEPTSLADPSTDTDIKWHRSRTLGLFMDYLHIDGAIAALNPVACFSLGN